MRKNLYKIDFRLVLLLLVIIIGAQLVLTFYSKNAFHSFLLNTQDWYQNYSVKRMANLTSTSLELLVETQITQKQLDRTQRNKVIKSFDIIFSQTPRRYASLYIIKISLFLLTMEKLFFQY
jgi:hypothetical protein